MLTSNATVEIQEPPARASRSGALTRGRGLSLVPVTTALPGNALEGGPTEAEARSKRIRNRAAILDRVLRMGEVIARLRPRQKRVCGVTAQPGKKVTLRRFQGGLRMLNLFKCRSTLVCPCCTSQHLESQREDISQLLVDNLTLKRDSIMVSLSVGFPEDASLAQRWATLAKMLEQLRDTTAVKQARSRVGRKATVKVVHLLHGDAGWHAHLHLVYVLDRRVTVAEVEHLEDVETAAWARIAQRHECIAEPIAQSYRRIGRSPKDCHEVARYLTKAIEETHFGDANLDEKQFRCRLDHKRNRSGWQLLNDVTFNGDVLALAPLKEWVDMLDSQTHQSGHFPTKFMETLHEEAKLNMFAEPKDTAA